VTQISNLGTRLRHLIDLLDQGVDSAYFAAGLEYRARFTPAVRVLLTIKRPSIRRIAMEAGITHSAASQTVAQMERFGLIRFEDGADKRERLVVATDQLHAMIPQLKEVWAATAQGARLLDKELGVNLQAVVEKAIDCLVERSFADRISKVVKCRL